MRKLLLSAVFLAAVGATPARAAVQVTVNDIGSILNESLSLPANDTPGLGIGFQEFFEFSLPTAETVTLSMTDSATGLQKIIGGVLSLNHWTSTGSVSPFVPMGALIESSLIGDFVGGQGATVVPDALAAGNYFAEVSGVSGLSPLHIAVDGTITASTSVGSSVPEPSTWAMILLGGAALAFMAMRKRRDDPRLAI